jgi:hypothetical protein
MVNSMFLLRAKPSCQVGKIYYFVVTQFGQLLHNLHKMIVFNIQSPTVTDHNKSRTELLDLINQEIFEYLQYRIGLVDLYCVILVFGDKVIKILI